MIVAVHAARRVPTLWCTDLERFIYLQNLLNLRETRNSQAIHAARRVPTLWRTHLEKFIYLQNLLNLRETRNSQAIHAARRVPTTHYQRKARSASIAVYQLKANN